MSKIRELPKASSRLLTSSQIICSVYSVVKELIENALDVESRNIEVKLENYGLEKIEVRDSASGILKDDIAFVAKPHFTSKITDHLDLSRIETYGFRGEALGAICSVADLVITTKTTYDDVGTTYSFDHNGEIVSTKLCSCGQGTNVTVLNLFQNLPVRKKYYRSEKNKKEELKKIEDLLISFGCIKYDVRFVLYHNKALIWQKSMASNTKQALIQSLGDFVVDYMEHSEFFDEKSEVKMDIFLPKCNAPVMCGHVSACRCIVAVNARPVRIKEIDKLLKQYYNKSGVNFSKPRYPVCYVSFILPPSKVDANVEPNKTNVLIHNLDKILEQLEEILKKTYQVHNSDVANGCTKTLQTAVMEIDIESSLNESETSDVITKSKFPQPITSLNVSEPPNIIAKPKFQKLVHASSSLTKVPSKNAVVGKTIHLESLETPAKKKKTTKRLSSPNDIHNHINTMKQFFSSENMPEQSNLNIPLRDESNPVAVANKSSGMDEVAKVFCVAESTGSGTTSFFKTSERKRHFSDSCIPLSQKENSAERSLSSSTNKAALWSIGLHPSGKQVEPVSVLQPKVVGTNKPDKICHDDYVDANTVSNVTAIQRQSIEKQTVNTLSLERKLSAFDIFCRQNRLEVAAENPNCNSPQIAKILIEKWSHMSPEEKAAYKSMAVQDYPKNIKKKEKLGKTISQNLIKMKSASAVKNPQRNHKEKLKEKTVFFEIEKVKNAYMKSGSENPEKEEFKIINYLAPGIWICSENNKISLLNSFRLQETIIYYRLLSTYQFEIEPVIPPQQIAINSLGGDDVLETLLQLNGGILNNSEYLNDERLIANGFKIAIRQGEDHMVVEILGMTKDISFYGFADLREIFALIIEKGSSTKLSDCRPGKIILYLQGEAVRIARQSHPSHRLEDIEGILEQRKLLPPNCDTCIHCKPFFNELWQKNAN